MNKKTPSITDVLNVDSKVLTDNLKDIFEKEEEYAMFLYAIEESVTAEYCQNRQLKDKEVIDYLNNLLKNLDESFDFFTTDFERHLYINILQALDIKNITKHELKLCLRYILWSIDNRSWLNSNQAYVLWLAHASGNMSKDEAKKYEKKIRTFCRRKGIPKAKADAMLSNNFDDVDLEDKEGTSIESIYFALDDTEKMQFVLENFHNVPFLGDLYLNELFENNDYDTAEKFCKRILKIMPGLPPIEMLLASIYKEKGNYSLSKIYLERVLNSLESIPKGAFKDRDEMEKQARQLLKDISNN